MQAPLNMGGFDITAAGNITCSGTLTAGPANVASLNVGGIAQIGALGFPATGTMHTYCYTDGTTGDFIISWNRQDSAHTYYLDFSPSGNLLIDGNPIWSALNMGPGSGLNADLLDGQQGAYYANVLGLLGYTPVQQGTGVGQLGNVVKIGWSSGSRVKVTIDSTDEGNIVTDPVLANGSLTHNGAAMQRGGNNLWGPDNDGAGSGLDADLLDGIDSSAFQRVTSQSLVNNGYTVLASGRIECWGEVIVPANGGTLVVTLPVTHNAFFNVSIAPWVKNSAGANANTGLLSKNGLASFTLINWETTSIEVDWRTIGA
jgi:hypothetical protein